MQPSPGQPPYGQPPYGQPPYGQPPYGQPPYGQPPYGQPPYGQPPYGQPPHLYPGGPGRRSHAGLWIGLGIAVLLIAALVGGFVVLRGSDDGSSGDGTGATGQPTVTSVNAASPVDRLCSILSRVGADYVPGVEAKADHRASRTSTAVISSCQIFTAVGSNQANFGSAAVDIVQNFPARGLPEPNARCQDYLRSAGYPKSGATQADGFDRPTYVRATDTGAVIDACHQGYQVTLQYSLSHDGAPALSETQRTARTLALYKALLSALQ